jgi:hypothetical protein
VAVADPSPPMGAAPFHLVEVPHSGSGGESSSPADGRFSRNVSGFRVNLKVLSPRRPKIEYITPRPLIPEKISQAQDLRFAIDLWTA